MPQFWRDKRASAVSVYSDEFLIISFVLRIGGDAVDVDQIQRGRWEQIVLCVVNRLKT